MVQFKVKTITFKYVKNTDLVVPDRKGEWHPPLFSVT